MRYANENELNESVEDLLQYIATAEKYGAPLPEKRSVWIVGPMVNDEVHDELHSFVHRKSGRNYVQAKTASILYVFAGIYQGAVRSLNTFLYHLSAKDEVAQNIRLLYGMIEPQEFEHLVAYLLQEHPTADDITQEDYVLSLFVEHEKNRFAERK